VRLAGGTAERLHELQRLLEKAVVALDMRFDEIRSPTPLQALRMLEGLIIQTQYDE
jgi:hypothetical protein